MNRRTLLKTALALPLAALPTQKAVPQNKNGRPILHVHFIPSHFVVTTYSHDVKVIMLEQQHAVWGKQGGWVPYRQPSLEIQDGRDTYRFYPNTDGTFLVAEKHNNQHQTFFFDDEMGDIIEMTTYNFDIRSTYGFRANDRKYNLREFGITIQKIIT